MTKWLKATTIEPIPLKVFKDNQGLYIKMNRLGLLSKIGLLLTGKIFVRFEVKDYENLIK
jgi:hypothetical protein